MSFILDFFKQIREVFGRKVVYYTGDGGNGAFEYNRPKVRLRDSGDLAEYIMWEKCVFFPKQVEKLTGVRQKELKSALVEELGRYPETDFSMKYIHFACLEGEDFKFYFEGEDRNRFFFWTATPFYSIDFFKCVMNVPYEQKDYFRMYSEFLKTLHTGIAEIANADWNMPITSPFLLPSLMFRFRITNRAPIAIRRKIRKLVKRKTFSYHPNQEQKEFVDNCIRQNPIVSHYIAEREVNRLLGGRQTQRQFNAIMTLAGYIKDF